MTEGELDSNMLQPTAIPMLAVVTYAAFSNAVANSDQLTPGPGDRVCIGNPLVINSAALYERLLNAHCIHLRGSLVFDNIDVSDQPPLSLKTLTGTVTVSPPSNRVAVMSALGRVCVACIGSLQDDYGEHVDADLCRADCNMTDGNIPASQKEGMMQNWTMETCPDVYHPFLNETFSVHDNETLHLNGVIIHDRDGMRMYKCSQAYNCSEWMHGTPWNDNMPEPCVRVCKGNHFLKAAAEFCRVPSGCTMLDGLLDIFISEQVILSNFSEACQRKLSRDGISRLQQSPCSPIAISTVLSTFYGDLVTITGKLIIYFTQHISNLDFLPRLRLIRGQVTHEFDMCPARKNAAALIIDTSLANIDQLQHVELGEGKHITAHGNRFLCADNSGVACRRQPERCNMMDNGLRAACTRLNSTLVQETGTLHWDGGTVNRTGICAIGYTTYFSQAIAGEVDHPQLGSEVCGLDDPRWKLLNVAVDSTDVPLLDLLQTDDGAGPAQLLSPCSHFKFVICVHRQHSNGMLDTYGHSVPSNTFTTGANSLTFSFRLAINGVTGYDGTITASVGVDPRKFRNIVDKGTTNVNVSFEISLQKPQPGSLGSSSSRTLLVDTYQMNLSDVVRNQCSRNAIVLTNETSKWLNEKLSSVKEGIQYRLSMGVCHDIGGGGGKDSDKSRCMDSVYMCSVPERIDSNHLMLVRVSESSCPTVATTSTTEHTNTKGSTASSTVVRRLVMAGTCVQYKCMEGFELEDEQDGHNRALLMCGVKGELTGKQSSTWLLPNCIVKSATVSSTDYLYFIVFGPVLTVVIIFLLWKSKRDRKKYRAWLALEMLKSREMTADYEEYQFDPAWELGPETLNLLREVGEGAFGKVYEGVWSSDEHGSLQVAVKTVVHGDNDAHRNAFLTEACIMKKFNSPYVVKLLGLVSADTTRPLVVMEFMSMGDLREYLIHCRPEHQRSFLNGTVNNFEARNIPTVELYMMWAIQLARGMDHLHEKRYVHRDLAARNCMLAMDLTLKVGDFGLTRDIYESDYYRKSGRGVLPVRWMAPESLRDGMYIAASDVWSYGIVLWEMATLGSQPYQGMGSDDLIHYVINGGHLDPPVVLHAYPDVLFTVMQDCWRFSPQDQPPFDQIINMLDEEPAIVLRETGL